jgi:hypothetical protein
LIIGNYLAPENPRGAGQFQQFHNSPGVARKFGINQRNYSVAEFIHPIAHLPRLAVQRLHPPPARFVRLFRRHPPPIKWEPFAEVTAIVITAEPEAPATP